MMSLPKTSPLYIAKLIPAIQEESVELHRKDRNREIQDDHG